MLVLTIHQIVVPIDFTETSGRALDYALDLAATFRAEVTVLHAYQIPVYSFPDGAFITGADIATQISNAAQQQLNEAVAAREDRGVKMTAVLRDGVAWEEVNTVAGQVHADLIVIGTHGRRGLARALLGSVAENIIRTSTVPVLTIHGPREEG